MNRAGKFEKVSFAQFAQAWGKADPSLPAEALAAMYEALLLPKRATTGSAGYDFFAPKDLLIPAQSEMLIPTGIRVRMDPRFVLLLFPRSGLGFKYRFQLNNTVGVIDSDYYGAENEGHILCRMFNDSRTGRDLHLAAGEGMLQGIFLPFGLTEDDQAEGVRTGGFGSTTGKETQ